MVAVLLVVVGPEQHLVFVTPLLPPATIAAIQDAIDTVVQDPDDGWRYHPKHVEQFPDINKLCKVASCWIYRVAQKNVYTIYLSIFLE
jgi:hypothetical protein